MKFLTIDTALNKSYIGLFLDGRKIIKEIESDEKNYHSAYLIKVLKDLLNENSININEIEFIGVNVGVGSFTGIRVGLAVVKVMADQLKIKTVSYTTSEVLSRAMNNKNVMLDARRGSVFYSKDGINMDLIPYNEAFEILENGEEFISDNQLFNNEKFANYKNKLIKYEDENLNIADIEIEITKEKIENNMLFEPYEIKPNYIQTAPVFLKK